MSSTFIPPTQLLGSLQWRYATKAFDPAAKIPADTWAALEESLVLSASSFGLQPYRFLVVQDPAKRAELLPHSWGQRQVVDASHFVVFAARTGLTAGEIDAFVDRIVEVRGVGRESLQGLRGMMTGALLNEGFQANAPQWAAHQVYLALGNLLTGAALLGIDACPMEGLVPAEYDRVLGLGAQGLHTVVACALGYRSPADKHAGFAKVRFPREQLVRTV